MAIIPNLTIGTILLLAQHAASKHTRIAKAQNKVHIRHSSLQCKLFSIQHMTLPGMPEIEPTFRCMAEDGKAKTVINIPQDFFKLGNFRSGETKISVPSSDIGQRLSSNESEDMFQHGIIDMVAGSGVIVKDSGSKRIERAPSFPRAGNLIFAVIRVSDKYHSPDLTVDQISDNIFGTSGDPVNMAIGYRECSGNKINISGEVIELTLSQNIDGLQSQDVEDYVTHELNSKEGFNPSAYTNVMYILPKQVNFRGAAAYAYLNGRLSVFSNQFASIHYVLMHEIGHNLGHHHSGSGTSAYGDNSGIMGTQAFSDDMPRACFNGAKSWWFSWYSDRHIEVTPTSESMILNMLSIDDYLNDQATSDDQYTIARIVGTNEADLFVMYNRAEGINSQVAGHRDQVTIVRQHGKHSQSWLEASLSIEEGAASNWIKRNWNGSGHDLVIKICKRVAGTPDYARVLVYLRGVNNLYCDNCISGETNLKIGIGNNIWGSKIEYWLKERNSVTELFDNIVLRDNRLPAKYYKKQVCIDNSKCYKFKIKNKRRNNDHGNVWYKIMSDYMTIQRSNFKDLRSEETLIGISC